MYKHYAPKTTLELWMIDNISGMFEKIMPDSWTPNVVTLLGNIACPTVCCLFMSQVGLKMTAEEPIEKHYFIAASFAVFWFS